MMARMSRHVLYVRIRVFMYIVNFWMMFYLVSGTANCSPYEIENRKTEQLALLYTTYIL